jgi:type I restriction enzyme S subunit
MREGWELKRLGEIYDVRDGTHDSPKFYDYGFPLITSKNLKSGDLNHNNVQYISKEDFEKINQRSKVHKGDILFAMIGTIGNPVLVKDEPSFAIKNVALFKIPSNQSNTFLQYYLQTPYVTQKMASDAKGTTQKFVGLGYLRNFPIFLPSLSEQNLIVSRLDESFAAISKAKENAEKNLANARGVFESYLNNVFTHPDNGWVTMKLKKLTSKIGSGATPLGGEKAYKQSGISLIRSLNVHDFGFMIKDLAHIDTIQATKLDNVTIEKDDVLLNITGASVARCCLVPERILPARVNQHVSIIRVKKEILLPNFLHYALISKIHKDNLLSTGEEGGSTRQALTKAQIEDYSLTFPPKIDDQIDILSKLDSLSAETKKLETIYKQKLADLEELKKSILEKAFNGELNTN